MDESHKREDEYSEQDGPGRETEEGGSESSSADKLPGAPASDDDSALGDTDQHSDA